MSVHPAVCLHHRPYEVAVRPSGGGYLDLATLYRNLVKEVLLAEERDRLHAMVKGGDWVFGSQLVDCAMQAAGLGASGQLPARLFCPQVVTDTGAKLSKSLIRDGRAPLPDGAAPWTLDTRMWAGSLPEYAGGLLSMADVPLSDPRHFLRSYSAGELGRLMTACDKEHHRTMTDTTPHVHELNLFRRNFDLVAAGRKSIEVRVRYPHLEDLAAGHLIRFRIKDTEETCEVRVTRVAEYPDFEALLDGEGPANINPTSSREQQLANIRSIYPPEKEALGALAIGIELVES